MPTRAIPVIVIRIQDVIVFSMSIERPEYWIFRNSTARYPIGLRPKPKGFTSLCGYTRNQQHHTIYKAVQIVSHILDPARCPARSVSTWQTSRQYCSHHAAVLHRNLSAKYMLL